MVRLSELVGRFGGACAPERADPDVLDVQLDSRRVGRGDLFAALPGATADGASFAPDALARGAVAVLSPRSLALEGTGRECANWVHPDARRVTGLAAAELHGWPARSLRTIGVTGTNGKSTTVHLCRQLLERARFRPAALGTIELCFPDGARREAAHTTPDAPELQRLLSEVRARGGDCAALEVSSHALDQERAAGLELDVAVFTNLSQDHLDYHGTMEAYAEAKARLFAHLKPGGTAVIHAGDPRAERMLRAARASGARCVSFGVDLPADLCASRLEADPRGTNLFLEGMGIPSTRSFLPLVGRHNVENGLAALAAVLSLGASPSQVLEGLAAVSAPRGRLEPVDAGGRPFQVWVDYAHTPDALERVLAALRERVDSRASATRAGRLLCVFGCGGERDATKRAPMGRVVARLADVALVTSDNPRGEEPRAIIDEILRGMAESRAEVLVEPDRRQAIRCALARARPGDVVLIAGKGHETSQSQRGQRLPFDDRLVAHEELP
jgi:UDP-N-acetylmuramoyl-L-alanyl-D-glutamate--2,6-diaminopimelate ligase